MNDVPAMQESILNAKISQLFHQNSELDRVEKEIYSAADRLSRIGYQLNSVGHPSNQISEACDPNKAEPSPCNSIKTGPDGIIGRLDTLFEINEDFMNRFNRVLRPLLDNIEHLEKHV